jgi:hypothetical protein
MMSRSKGPPSQVWGLRLPKAWIDELDQEVAESEGEIGDRTELVKSLIAAHLKTRRERKTRKKR